MVHVEVQETLAPNKEFMNSIFEYPDGLRLKTCIQCGTCAGACPFGMWMDYTPRKIIHALRMNEFEDVLESEKVWMCVACYACADACPQQIPLTNALMTRLKEEILLTGNLPAELQEALENTQRYGNPMGNSARLRAEWAKSLSPAVPILGREHRSVDVLWYVGDYASYHPAVIDSTVAFAKILQALGIDFGILGSQEISDGDSQRLAGEKGLFEMLAEKNGKVFERYDFKEIVTTDPHAFNAMKNEYPKLGISYPVRHYTQFLAGYLADITLMLKKEINALVAFHDPCFLGRVNDIYEKPRLLIQAIPGIELIEMSHNRSNSLCCGGGGGGMWLDGYSWDIAETRSSEWRVQEVIPAKPIQDIVTVFDSSNRTFKKDGNGRSAAQIPAQRILAVACPYEKPRFDDARKVVSGAENLAIMDIAEMLADSMEI
jgi:Fe-S oxidoreductase